MKEIPSFESVRILVVGDVMLDRYWHGDAHRISPEAPVPIINVNHLHEQPGGAGNVALNLRALGCQVDLLSIVGEDPASDILEQQLSAAGVNCYFHRLPDFQTIIKLRIFSLHQQLVRLDFESKLDTIKTKHLIVHVKHLLKQADVLLLSDYAKGTLHHSKAFIQAAKKAHIPILVDPKSIDFSCYHGATIVTPNQKEFEAIVGPFSNEAELVAKGYNLIKDYELTALLVTRSEQGMTLLCKKTEPLHLPTRTREVYDVTGAGDTVISVFAAMLGVGQTFEQAAVLANIAAGVTVEKLGAVAITRHELYHAVKGQYSDWAIISTQAALSHFLATLKTYKETIVMTNGCFDILHAGHVQYLEEAKSLGDKLIVAVNDDESVRRLKGNNRPIVPLAQRMAVLAGLKAVDWVISFSDDTPEKLIQQIKPAILVKGGDYKEITQIAGAELVLNHQGKVQVLNFKAGCSTSEMIRKIHDLKNQL